MPSSARGISDETLHAHSKGRGSVVSSKLSLTLHASERDVAAGNSHRRDNSARSASVDEKTRTSDLLEHMNATCIFEKRGSSAFSVTESGVSDVVAAENSLVGMTATSHMGMAATSHTGMTATSLLGTIATSHLGMTATCYSANSLEEKTQTSELLVSSSTLGRELNHYSDARDSLPSSQSDSKTGSVVPMETDQTSHESQKHDRQ